MKPLLNLSAPIAIAFVCASLLSCQPPPAGKARREAPEKAEVAAGKPAPAAAGAPVEPAPQKEVAAAAPSPVAAPATPPKPPPMTGVLLERVVLRGEGGIAGINAGTRVVILEEKGETLKVSDGPREFEVRREQFRRDAGDLESPSAAPPPTMAVKESSPSPVEGVPNGPRPQQYPEHIPLAQLGQHLARLMAEIPSIKDEPRLRMEISSLPSQEQRIWAIILQLEDERNRLQEQFRLIIDAKADSRHQEQKRRVAELAAQRLALKNKIQALKPRAKTHYDLRRQVEGMEVDLGRLEAQSKQLDALSNRAYDLKSFLYRGLSTPEDLLKREHEYLDKQARDKLRQLVAVRNQKAQYEQLRSQVTQVLAELNNRLAVVYSATVHSDSTSPE